MITNACPNPSFEVSLAGYTAVLGAEITQVFTDAFSGRASMQVSTPGLQAGEGFYGPAAFFSTPVTGAVSAYFWGETGTIQVSAVANPGGQVLGTTTVALAPNWPRAALSNLAFPADSDIYILVQTTSAQVLTFLVDAVQYEPESPVSRYIDGDTYGCQWMGTPGLSSSEMPIANPIYLNGGIYAEGTINIVVPGTVSTITSVLGTIDCTGSITLTVAYPAACMDDFAMYALTDPDPAMTYIGPNTAGQSSGENSYARSSAIFYPPLDYPDSSGALLWPRAAYLAVGFEFVGIPASQAANVTAVQVEQVPLAGNSDTAPGPSAYDTPRAVHAIIRPTRLNYAPNPSIESGTGGFTGIGNGQFLQDPNTYYNVNGTWDGVPLTTETHSLAVTTYNLADGAALTVPFLFYGETFIASAYVWCPNPSMTGVQLVFPDGSGTILDSGVDASDPTGWLRPWIVFQANESTVNLGFQPLNYYGTFWLDDILIEEGSTLGSYFDGGFTNPDYMWETSGTPGATRSYYYENFALKQSVVDTILAQHVPVGIMAAAPVYGQPPTQ